VITSSNAFPSGQNLGGRGGAISNTSNALLRASGLLLTNNTAALGGAIHNAKGGTVVLTNSTLDQNIATISGGAVYNADGATLP
jgi:hypothetical protein